MPLGPGARLGLYEIQSAIGAGGMGEVYRARDTKLGRDVALKVLPEALAADPERLARLRREAQILASLNHPNIAAIHGFEDGGDIHALVLEFVEGETLADRIARGPVPLDEALPIAKQIADALEAAHDQGIIHRDLKPANIKIRPDSSVKVLDFGLAKLAEGGGSGKAREAGAIAGLSLSPTITSPAMTGIGVLLGTAAYMAPEQARGRVLDKRADIWAFGCVLFEMLSGRRAFGGEDVAETLGAVIHKDPPWEALPGDTPPALRALLRRSLQKDPKQRLRDVGDARIEIEAAQRGEHDPAATGASIPIRRWPLVLMGTIAGASITAAGAFAFFYLRQPAPIAADPVAFNITLPDDSTVPANVRPVVSPDGRQVAFIATTSGRRAIWVRSIGSLDARPLPGTEDADGVFWSPDSRHIGFAAGTSSYNVGKLKRVDASGGPPVTLCDLPGGYRGAAWSGRGTVLLAVAPLGLFTVADTGGTPTRLTTGDRAILPSFLPDGRHFLYTRATTATGTGGLYVGALDEASTPKDEKPILSDQSGAVYAEGANPDRGYLLIVRDNSLMAQPFDAERLAVAGESIPVADNIVQPANAIAFSASATGTLAFRSRGALGDESRLIWFDRKGMPLGQVGPPGRYGSLRLSLDGKTLVVDALAAQSNIRKEWIVDVRRGTFGLVSPGSEGDTGVALSPDGRLAYTVAASGDMYVRYASGAGDAELLVKSQDLKHPNDWSRDGRFMVYDDHHPTRRQDLYVVPMSGNRKPVPFAATPADETEAAFSPDGRWIAYSSDESGRREVYVRDFVADRVPATGSVKVAISTAGGYKPRWRADGRELFYLALDGTMMAVPVMSGTTFEPGIPVSLFKSNATGFFPYDVSADGRFLVNTLPESAGTGSPITVMLNWQSTLKK